MIWLKFSISDWFLLFQGGRADVKLRLMKVILEAVPSHFQKSKH